MNVRTVIQDTRVSWTPFLPRYRERRSHSSFRSCRCIHLQLGTDKFEQRTTPHGEINDMWVTRSNDAHLYDDDAVLENRTQAAARADPVFQLSGGRA
jgi:hypothetical protein